MSEPDGSSKSAKEDVSRAVERLPASTREVLKKKEKKDVGSSLEAAQEKLDAQQKKIFSEAIAAHLKRARGGGAPKKLEFGWDPKQMLWFQKEGGGSALTFVVSISAKRVVAPKALVAAEDADLPTGWMWERKSTKAHPDDDWRLMVSESWKVQEQKRQVLVEQSLKETYPTTGVYKFETGENGDVFVRMGEPPEGFILPIETDNPKAKFKIRGGMLWLEVRGISYRIARRETRGYYRNMEDYATDAQVTPPRFVKTGGKVTLSYPNHDFVLAAPVVDTQFWSIDVVRERVDNNADNDEYGVEPAGRRFERIMGPGGLVCRVRDAPDFATGTCGAATLFLERTGFTLRQGGRPPAIVSGADALHERRRWRLATRFGRQSEHVFSSATQVHCPVGNWQGIRIHYSIGRDVVDAGDNFNADEGHLTLELGNWVLGNNRFYRYWFDTGTVAVPAGGTIYAYEQYVLLYPDNPPSHAVFRNTVENGLQGFGDQFAIDHNI